VRAKRLPEADDEFASQASEFDTIAALRQDIERQLRERDERAVEREFELAVLDAAVANAQVEVPPQLVHARAHEMVQDAMEGLARQGVKPETYLRVTGRTEEQLAKEAEADAERALRREAVLAAIVEAEGIHPSDEELKAELLEPAARGGKIGVDQLAEQLRAGGRLERMRAELAARRALELIVKQAKPISVAQARAREQLWTPQRQGGGAASTQLWTPGS